MIRSVCCKVELRLKKWRRNGMKTNLILVIAIISVFISGCTANTKLPENVTIRDEPTVNPLKNTKWQVESFGTADNRQQVLRIQSPTQGTEPAVEFSEAKGGGRLGGCNQISFDYTASGSKFTTKNVATTVMACAKEVLIQEQELMKAVEQASEFRLNGDDLDIIYNGDKFIRLKRIKTETK